MTDAQQLGLLMLTWVCQRVESRYHDLTDTDLRQFARFQRREVNQLAEYVAECRAALAEANREHEYQSAQLQLIEGIIEVRRCG